MRDIQRPNDPRKYARADNLPGKPIVHIDEVEDLRKQHGCVDLRHLEDGRTVHEHSYPGRKGAGAKYFARNPRVDTPRAIPESREAGLAGESFTHRHLKSALASTMSMRLQINDQDVSLTFSEVLLEAAFGGIGKSVRVDAVGKISGPDRVHDIFAGWLAIEIVVTNGIDEGKRNFFENIDIGVVALYPPAGVIERVEQTVRDAQSAAPEVRRKIEEECIRELKALLESPHYWNIFRRPGIAKSGPRGMAIGPEDPFGTLSVPVPVPLAPKPHDPEAHFDLTKSPYSLTMCNGRLLASGQDQTLRSGGEGENSQGSAISGWRGSLSRIWSIIERVVSGLFSS